MLLIFTFVALLALFTHISALVIPHDQRIINPIVSEKKYTAAVGKKPAANNEGGTITYPTNFGVGIHLSAGYATVSVAYDNGTILDIAKVEARPEYKKMIKRLSSDSSKHPTPPYTTIGNAIIDRERQAERERRKDQGLPASDDVFTFAELLRSAREEVELYLWRPIEIVTVSTLNLVAVYTEDLKDALDFIGMNITKDGSHDLPLLHSSSSSIVSNGYGLCQNKTNLSSCLETHADYPERNVISIEYTREALIIESMVLSPKLNFWPTTLSRPIIRFNLGHDALRSDPSGAFYWATVSEALSKVIMQQLGSRRTPSQIFLSGENASDPTFRTVLRQITTTLIGQVPEIRDEVPLYAASRGAAYIALKGGIKAIS